MKELQREASLRARREREAERGEAVELGKRFEEVASSL
jgi:hypothetical protein